MPYLIDPAIPEGHLGKSPQPTIAVSDAVALRPWRGEDAGALVRAFADPAIQRWHTRRLDSLDEAQQLIAGWQAGWASERECHWALTDVVSEELLGRMALKGVDLLDGSAGFAYWMVPAARGRGLCADAVMALAQWAFREVGFHRLGIEHSVANPASCGVARRAGFVVEGVRRGAAQHAEGWHDMCAHSRLATDA